MLKTEIEKTLAGLTFDNAFAIGNDLVQVTGFSHSCDEPFKKKVYTDAEIAYCESFSEPLLRFASTWAAKEAVYKAVKQLDQTLMGWRDIEILRNKPSGQPAVILHKHPQKFVTSLTISHDGDYVWAVALIKPVAVTPTRAACI